MIMCLHCFSDWFLVYSMSYLVSAVLFSILVVVPRWFKVRSGPSNERPRVQCGVMPKYIQTLGCGSRTKYLPTFSNWADEHLSSNIMYIYIYLRANAPHRLRRISRPSISSQCGGWKAFGWGPASDIYSLRFLKKNHGILCWK